LLLERSYWKMDRYKAPTSGQYVHAVLIVVGLQVTA
jgi:hypothetical protein